MDRIIPTISRRRLVKGIVAGGLALPLPGLLARAVRAADSEPPRRLVCFYIPDGCSQPHWHPSGSETSFTLPSMTSPLESLKSELVFLQGLNMYSGGSTHEGGAAKVLTATGDVSIDVFAGNAYKSVTPHASLHLGVASSHEGSTYVSYLGKDQPVTPEDNPQRAFERLFGTPGGIDDPAQRRRLSILDCAKNDLSRLQSRLGSAEKQKLELHAESLLAVEKRINEAAQESAGSCGNPTWNTGGWSVPDGYSSYPAYYNREDQFADVGKLQMDLAVLALQCDLTRAVTIQWSHPVSPTNLHDYTGVDIRHHDASHFDASSESSIAVYAQLKQWYMQQFAYLVNELKSVPEGSGSLLDNTLIFLCSELGHSSRHDHVDMPFILAGGAAGLRTGRYLDYRGSNNGENESHAKLLVSIAQALGIAVDSFGYTGHGTGPLPRLYA